MAIYNYKGLNKQGKEVKATVNAESIVLAKQKVKAMGFMLLDITEQKSENIGKGLNFTMGSGVSVNDLALMTRQLSTLIKARIQIVEALSALQEQMDNPTLRVILSELKQKVNEGSSLANSLSGYPKVFDNVYVNMVEAGEASGTLDVVLLRLAEFTEAQVKLKNKIQGAMVYPLVMGIFGFLMMNVIFIFVIPKIAKVLISAKKELPIQTKICLGISSFLQNYWYLVFVGIFAGIWLTRRYLKTTKGRSQWDALQLKLPIFGIIIKMINVSRFCSTLATLMNSGVPILTSITIVKNLIPNVHLKDTIEKARISISEGGSMTTPLIQSGYFPPLVTHMIKLGEKSGEIEDMLKIISESYEEQVQSRIGGLTALLEPLMMIALGMAVAFIVFSVIVPIMNLNSVR
ncbi:MAG: type II secretion system F family protein [Bacteriovoracaceae bacterium]